MLLLVTKYILNSTNFKCSQNIKLYHFVRTILSIPFCPMPFCPCTILSIPFCPYHFVCYHFVRTILSATILSGHHLGTCLMYSTGCPSSSGSYSVLVPWSGGVSWVLLRPTSEIFAVPPRAPEVAVHSDIGTGVTLCSFRSYIHNPGPCILGGWSLCVEWASVVAKIAAQEDSF